MMRKHGTLKFIPDHMNVILVETWEDFKITPTLINQEDFNKTHLLPLSTPDKDTHHKYCLTYNQTSKHPLESPHPVSSPKGM